MHGYTAASPANMEFNAGALLVGSTPIGTSRGGCSFEENAEIRQLEFDGKRADIVGNDRIEGYAPTITGTFLEMGTDTNIPRLERGAAFTGTTTKVLTPRSAGTFVPKVGGYLQDVRLIGVRGDGKYVAIHFPYAFVAQWSKKTNDKGEVEYSVTLVARLDPTGTPLDLSAPPHRIEVRDAAP